MDVEWDSGAKNSYRYGKDSAFDVKVTKTKHTLYLLLLFILKLKVWFEEKCLIIYLTPGTNTLTITICHDKIAMPQNALPSVDAFSNRNRLSRESPCGQPIKDSGHCPAVYIASPCDQVLVQFSDQLNNRLPKVEQSV